MNIKNLIKLSALFVGISLNLVHSEMIDDSISTSESEFDLGFSSNILLGNEFDGSLIGRDGFVLIGAAPASDLDFDDEDEPVLNFHYRN